MRAAQGVAMGGRLRQLAAVMVATGMVSAAGGQVAQRNVGQALDANPQIGSGGFNTVTGGADGVNSQLFVTGQVTGLRSFRGNIGYFAPDQLQMNVPSAGLSDFNRRSAGVGIIVGGGYVASPYYDRSATVFGVRGITGGYTAP